MNFHTTRLSKTDRHLQSADTTEIIYHAASRVVNKIEQTVSSYFWALLVLTVILL